MVVISSQCLDKELLGVAGLNTVGTRCLCSQFNTILDRKLLGIAGLKKPNGEETLGLQDQCQMIGIRHRDCRPKYANGKKKSGLQN